MLLLLRVRENLSEINKLQKQDDNNISIRNTERQNYVVNNFLSIYKRIFPFSLWRVK